jgi:hypothetical protein
MAVEGHQRWLALSLQGAGAGRHRHARHERESETPPTFVDGADNAERVDEKGRLLRYEHTDAVARQHGRRWSTRKRRPASATHTAYTCSCRRCRSLDGIMLLPRVRERDKVGNMVPESMVAAEKRLEQLSEAECGNCRHSRVCR